MDSWIKLHESSDCQVFVWLAHHRTAFNWSRSVGHWTATATEMLSLLSRGINHLKCRPAKQWGRHNIKEETHARPSHRFRYYYKTAHKTPTLPAFTCFFFLFSAIVTQTKYRLNTIEPTCSIAMRWHFKFCWCSCEFVLSNQITQWGKFFELCFICHKFSF